MVLTPDPGYSSQALVLDPTAPGHIHLRAPGANIDEPSANIFLGGEDSSFEVGYYNGSAPNVFVHSGGNTWTFGNDGTTTFPTGNITSNTSLRFTTTFANVNTVEYQTAGVWDVYVEDTTTGTNDAWSWINVTFKDNLIDKPEVFIENQKANDGIAQRWTFDENGILNFPRDVAGNTDPYLSIEGGAIPKIQSTDVSLGGPANLAIQSNYLNLSGSTGNRIILQADAGAIATDAAMVLSTNLADPGNIVSWTLDTTGNLYLPDTTSVIANVSITLEANDSGNITGLSVIGVANANLYAHGNVTIVSDSSNTNATWTFGTNGNLILPQGGIVTNNIPPVTFDILYQYDNLVWSGNTLTFTNASSTYMLQVLALMEVGDAITLGSTATTVTGVYTGGGAGTFTVSGTGAGQQIAQFTLPNRLTSVNGIKLTTNAKNYLFTEAGVTQSPVLTVDTLPSGQFVVAGFRAFVSDSNLSAVGNFGAIIGNSGSNTVCVWCDGTNWRIG